MFIHRWCREKFRHSLAERALIADSAAFDLERPVPVLPISCRQCTAAPSAMRSPARCSCGFPLHIALSASCKPSHALPTVFLTDEGGLRPQSRLGSPYPARRHRKQAKCLCVAKIKTRNLGPTTPENLAGRPDQPGRPRHRPASRETLSSLFCRSRILENGFRRQPLAARSPTPENI